MHLQFIDIRLDIFANDFGMKPRTGICVIVQGNLLLKKLVGFRLDIAHDLLISLCVGRLSFVLVDLFWISLESLFQGVEFLVMGKLVFFAILWSFNHSIYYNWDDVCLHINNHLMLYFTDNSCLICLSVFSTVRSMFLWTTISTISSPFLYLAKTINVATNDQVLYRSRDGTSFEYQDHSASTAFLIDYIKVLLLPNVIHTYLRKFVNIGSSDARWWNNRMIYIWKYRGGQLYE